MSTSSSTGSPPDPSDLVQRAAAEITRRPLRDYAETIQTLRDKGFSYRDIAAWLTERGVPTDHNAVYRVLPETSTGSGEAGLPKPARRRQRGANPSPDLQTSSPSRYEESTLLD